jgi:hypothetical protein
MGSLQNDSLGAFDPTEEHRDFRLRDVSKSAVIGSACIRLVSIPTKEHPHFCLELIENSSPTGSSKSIQETCRTAARSQRVQVGSLDSLVAQHE